MKATEDVISKATEAFWDVVTQSYPDIKSKNHNPTQECVFHDNCAQAINQWLENNSTFKIQHRVCEYLNGSPDWVWRDNNKDVHYESKELCEIAIRENFPNETIGETIRTVNSNAKKMKHYME